MLLGVLFIHIYFMYCCLRFNKTAYILSYAFFNDAVLAADHHKIVNSSAICTVSSLP